MHISTDIGGTFTDFVVFKRGKLMTFKVHSTPEAPAQAVKQGLNQLFSLNIAKKLAQPPIFSHGTTVATNTAIERKGTKTAMITTKGFSDILEIGRQTRPSLYDFNITRTEPLVPRELCFEISERVGADGKIKNQLNNTELRKIIQQIKNLNRSKYKNNKIDTIAICLLFSFLNAQHEKLVASEIRKNSKLLPVLSSEVLPEFREYERFSTTVLEAYLKNIINEYLDNLSAILKTSQIREFYMMQSNGGVATAAAVRKRVVNTLLSGPAAGVAASRHLGATLGLKNLITFDMGGTSTDVSSIIGGEMQWTSEGKIATLPFSIPIIDIITIGAGGGSIAWMDEGGALRVGPQSAGADPGPICYGRGGEKVTVTDCDLLARYLNPNYFLDGKMALNNDLSKKLIDDFASKSSLKFNSAIGGVIEVVNSNMIRALRKVSIERGYDPRDFAMVAFGGAGPVHAAILAKELNIPKVIVPQIPGVFSALGLLISDVRSNYSKTKIISINDRMASSEINKILTQHNKKANRDLELQKLSTKNTTFLPSLDMRYKGQSYEINVEYSKDIAKIAKKFHELHKQRYGYFTQDRELEIVNVRLAVITARNKSAISTNKSLFPKKVCKHKNRKIIDHREILFNPSEERIETEIYRRDDLPLGFKSNGPAVIEEASSTTVVYPGMNFQVDNFGNIHIFCK